MNINTDQIKKVAIIFLACTVGSVLIQLAAPMILAALISASSLAIPFLLYHLLVEKGWQIHLVKKTKKVECQDAGDETEKGNGEGCGQDQAENHEEGVISPEEEAVSFWYNQKGKQQMDRIIASLYSRGIYDCWIRKDGICNYKTEKGYRRVGIFQDYPGENATMLAKILRNEDLNAVDQGKYLYIAWAEA